jgi:excisionase family DNA binding protein
VQAEELKIMKQISKSEQSKTENSRSSQAGELLTIAEVADYLKLSRRTAWRWCKSGQLPAFKVGHQWRVAKSDLEDFIQQRT